MPLVPDSKQGKVTFFRSKCLPWAEHATAIGTTSSAVTSFESLVASAEAKMAAQTAALGVYRASVLDADQGVEAMAKAGADIIAAIRTKARTAGDGVYTLAQIPPPDQPSPIGNPGTPYQLKIDLKPNGSLGMRWKCENPAGATGTIYHLFRRVGNEPFTFIGGSGSRSFVDTTLPAGVPQVIYQIQAARTTAMGDAAEFIVNFGTSSTGQMSVSVEQTTPSKIAA